VILALPGDELVVVLFNVYGGPEEVMLPEEVVSGFKLDAVHKEDAVTVTVLLLTTLLGVELAAVEDDDVETGTALLELAVYVGVHWSAGSGKVPFALPEPP